MSLTNRDAPGMMEFVKDASSAWLTGVSAAFDALQDQWQQISTPLEVKHQQALDVFRQHFQQYAQQAEDFATIARNQGNTALGDAADSFANHFHQKANALLDPVIDAHAKLANLKNSWDAATEVMQRQVPVLGEAFARNVGVFGDAVETAQGWAELFEGNPDKLANVSLAIIGAEVVAGAAVAAGLVLGAPAVLTAVAAGLLAAGTAWALDKFGVGAAITEDLRRGLRYLEDLIGLNDPETDNPSPQGTGTDPDGDGIADSPTFRMPFDVLAEMQRAAAVWRMFRGDPLVLDLKVEPDVPGIQLVQAASSQANFDLNGDGVRERVGWIGPSDGFLAIDADGDGKIRDIHELFGSETQTGFEELAEHDLEENGGNEDGKIDAEDAVFSELQIWRDLNGDGDVSFGELRSIADYEIKSISLEFDAFTEPSSNPGTILTEIGTYELNDGTTRAAGDALLERQTLVGNVYTPVTETPTALGLPNFRGFGGMTDLRQAMSGALTGGVVAGNGLTSSVQALLAGTPQQILDGMDEVLYRWAGTINAVAGSRGSFIDARRLGALEALTGTPFRNVQSGPNPLADTAAILNNAWTMVREHYAARFLVFGSWFRQIFPNAAYSSSTDFLVLNEDPRNVGGLLRRMRAAGDPNAETAISLLPLVYRASESGRNDLLLFDAAGNASVISTVTGVAFTDTGAGADFVTSGALQGLHYTGIGNDTFTFSNGGNHKLVNDGGDDVIRSLAAGDFVIAAAGGNNRIDLRGGTHAISTGSGNDTIDLGSGDSYVDAGGGNNMINTNLAIGQVGKVWIRTGDGFDNIGWGHNMPLRMQGDITVRAGDGWKRIWLGHGVHDILLGNDLSTSTGIIDVGDGNSTIRTGSGNHSITGGAGDHIVTTGAGNQSVRLGAGNQVVTTGSGNDTIDLGAGDQVIEAGQGNNMINSNLAIGQVGTVTIRTGDGFDNIGWGHNLPDRMQGNITVRTGDGWKRIWLGHGLHDIVTGTNTSPTSASIVDLGDGDATVTTGGGLQSIRIGAGDHTVITSAGNDTIDLGAGNHFIHAGGGNNLINTTLATGQLGNVTIHTGDGFDNIGWGHNMPLRMQGDITVRAGDGWKRIWLGHGLHDIVVGNNASPTSASVIDLGNGNATVTTGSGNYSVVVGTGNHAITTGSGNDTIDLASGDSSIDAGGGNNMINTNLATGQAGTVTIRTGDGFDNIGSGVALANRMQGDITVRTGGGWKRIWLGHGLHDIVLGDNLSTSANVVDLGDGNSLITTGLGHQGVRIGVGDHTVTTRAGNDTIDLGSGNHVVNTGDGDDLINTNLATGQTGTVSLDIGAGNDMIGNGAALASRMQGDVTVRGGNGWKRIWLGHGLHDVQVGNNTSTSSATISLGDGASTVVAGSGHWAISAGSGPHAVTTSSGNDQIDLGSGSHVINAGNGDNLINTVLVTGQTGDTVINTGVGNDMIGTGAAIASRMQGNITVRTGDGWKRIWLGHGDHDIQVGSHALGGFGVISLGDGDSTVLTGSGHWLVSAGAGSHAVTTAGGNDQIDLGSGDHVIHAGAGDDLINTLTVSTPQIGTVHIDSGAGNDLIGSTNITLDNRMRGAVTVRAGNGWKRIYLGHGQHDIEIGNNTSSSAGDIQLGNGNQRVVTGDGNQIVSAGAGDHSITTGSGSDTINLGAGNHVVNAGGGSNSINANVMNGQTGTVHITTGAGNDTIGSSSTAFANRMQGDITVRMGDGMKRIYLGNGLHDIEIGNNAPTSAPSEISLGDGNARIVTGSGPQTITAGAGDHTVTTGASGNHTVSLGVGDHSVTTGAGADSINLGAGNHLIHAGDGNNSINASLFTGQTGTVSITTGTGNDSIGTSSALLGARMQGDITVRMGDGWKRIWLGHGLHDIEIGGNASGNTNEIHLGDGASRVVTGAGNQVINIGAGNHTVTTGSGSDTINLAGGSHVIDAGSGNNSINTSTMNGQTGTVRITTGAGNDVIGSASASVANRMQGDITVRMGDGWKRMWLGHGAHDIEIGNNATGNTNEIRLGNGSARVVTGSGNQIISLGTGDHVVATGSGADTLWGQGNDSLDGGAGNDLYFEVGGGLDVVADAAGTDTVSFASGILQSQLSLGVAGGALTLTSSAGQLRVAGFDAQQAESSLAIENFTFGSSTFTRAQMLALGFDWAGTAEGETLVGTSVTDRFDGAGGDDILSGGRGNDRYVFRAGSGHDEVRDLDTTAGNLDTVVMTGIASSMVQAIQTETHIILQLDGENSLTIQWDPANGAAVERVEFTDAVWDRAMLEAQALPPNTAPTSTDDSVTTAEDTAVVLGLADFGNYADAESTPLAEVRISALPGVGSLQFDNAGSWLAVVAGQVIGAADIAAGRLRFVPAANAYGEDYATVRFSVGDGLHFSTQDYALTIDVTPVADGPDAVADTLPATEDTPLVFSASQLLGNDSTDGGGTLSIASVESGAGGTAVLNADGTVSFTPNANFSGAAGFTYRATDGNAISSPAAVTVNVAPVNDAPVTVADALATSQDTPVLVSAFQLLNNDTDVENDSLSIAFVANGIGGTAVLNADGSVTFTPDAGFSGTADFSYVASDGEDLSAPATVSVSVAAAPGTFIGTEGADVLAGGGGSDVIMGLGGDDVLSGNGGDDQIDGGTGNDLLEGGAGSDFYLFQRGYGADVIVDEASAAAFDPADQSSLFALLAAGQLNAVSFGAGITLDDIDLFVVDGALQVRLGGDDMVVVGGFDLGDPLGEHAIKLFAFQQNGALVSYADLLALGYEVVEANSPPEVVQALDDQQAQEETPFVFGVPAGAFSDAEGALAYSVGELPAWLSFDPATATFSGTPLQADVGAVDVTVTATDSGGLSAQDTFTITVANVNDAPVVSAANATVLLGQSVAAASFFSVADADGTEPQRYELWDSTAGNGQWTVGGAGQGVNVAIGVTDLADVRFVGAEAIGSDLVWVRAYDGEAWSAWKSWTIASAPHLTNAAPVVAAENGALLRNESVAASSLFTVSDADGDPVTRYEFWDDVEGGGYFALGGLAQGTNPIAIGAEQLADLQYVGGADPGTERVWVRAFDGMEWSAWKAWNMSTALHLPNAAPVVSAPNATVLLGQAVEAADLVSVSDADSDPAVRYEFWDSTAGNGHWSVEGVAQGVNVAIAVDDLADVRFVGASATGSDLVWVRASDGQTWSDWKSWTINSWPHLTNAAPVVSAANAAILTNEVVAAASLFAWSDADGDAAAKYEFWDDVNGGGYFRVGGVQQSAALGITVLAADLANAEYVGGAAPGSERVWVRVNDGLEWSAWKAWNMTSALHIPNAAPVVSADSRTVLLGESVEAAALFSAADADGDAVTRYELWDSTAGNGQWTVAGIGQGVNLAISVTDLADVRFVGAASAGSDLVWARAYDGQTWGDWKSWTVNSWPHLTNAAPFVLAADAGVLREQAVAAAPLFEALDVDGDAVAKYEFWDDVNGGGYWRKDGVQQAAGQAIGVSAGELAALEYVGGANAGTERVWVRAHDGLAWGAWKSWLMSTEGGMLHGGTGPDALAGEDGPTVLQGGAGNDTLGDPGGNNVLDGGQGNDEVSGGDGNDLLAGGDGDDRIDTGDGSNVIVFNSGDGVDTVFSGAAASNTLSLGGGIAYDDLSLSKSGNDLIVNTGGDDRVVLKDWYAGGNTVHDLQIILDASAAYDAESADPLRNRRVQTFDFLGMVAEFDQALAQSPGLTSWALTNALLQFHLSGADDAALGGDLAYWYGRNGGFGGISLQAAQQVLGSASFGAEAQSLRPFNGLQEGFVKLT